MINGNELVRAVRGPIILHHDRDAVCAGSFPRLVGVFPQTWPVILIVVGLLALLGRATRSGTHRGRSGMRPRRSLTGPLILILIGVAFLTRNLWQEVPLFQLVAQYWPFLLIAWGVLRLLEVLLEAARSKPLPTGGLSGGEVALIVLLCVIGSGMYAADRHGMHFAPFGTVGLEMFGEEYDYRTSSEKTAKGTVHVVFENLRGNVRVNGTDDSAIKVDEHKMIRRLQQERCGSGRQTVADRDCSRRRPHSRAHQSGESFACKAYLVRPGSESAALGDH